MLAQAEERSAERKGAERRSKNDARRVQMPGVRLTKAKRDGG